VPELCHVSEEGPFRRMVPRPAADGGAPAVWAVDQEHLAHYLLPRDCPRVCWATAGVSDPVLASPAPRVVAVESGWLPRIAAAVLHVHHLDPAGFTLRDGTAGYWTSPWDVDVRGVETVRDSLTALADRGVELRVTPELWSYRDAVVRGAAEFSAIRMRNARPAG